MTQAQTLTAPHACLQCLAPGALTGQSGRRRTIGKTYFGPDAGANPNRTTRIFVARIPAHVTDEQFRSYFAQYGAVQDAYMPKDASKNGHRGIGFVTFASPDSVEKVRLEHCILSSGTDMEEHVGSALL